MPAWLALCAILVGDSSGAPPAEALQHANAALDALELEKAASLYEALIASDAPDDVRAQAFLGLGLTRASLLDQNGARAAFAAALAIDPHLSLPTDTSPKVHDLFESTRATVMPAGAPPPRAPPPLPPPPAPPPPAAPPEEPRDPRLAWLLGGGVLLGGSALTGTVALVADGVLSSPVAGRSREEYEATRSFGIAALASSVVLGAAGALAIIGSFALVEEPG